MTIGPSYGQAPLPFTGARLSPSPRYPSPQRPETRPRGPGKPVGTVWFAVNSERGTRSIRQLFEGDSMAVQEQAIAFALDLIIEEIDAGA